MAHITSQISEKNEVLVARLRVYGENVGNIPPSGQCPGGEWNPDLPNMKQERHEDIQSTVL
jgi:hypothetical protein